MLIVLHNLGKRSVISYRFGLWRAASLLHNPIGLRPRSSLYRASPLPADAPAIIIYSSLTLCLTTIVTMCANSTITSNLHSELFYNMNPSLLLLTPNLTKHYKAISSPNFECKPYAGHYVHVELKLSLRPNLD